MIAARRLVSVRRLLILLLAALPFASGRAAEIPTAPILRIETGMHGAAIDGLAIDEADQQVVTVSDDKTVRVWSATGGDLVSTARGPIGAGPEGALYAVALSPSGKTIAVGGYTGISWDQSASLYLFNRTDGNWVGRISFGNIRTDAINHIAFSPDGRYVAVAANDAKGLRIVDTVGRAINIVDADYKDAIEWLDFAKDGRLVTSSLDGAVRLYDPSFKRIAIYRAQNGQKPLTVAFSKNGVQVAVGLLNSAAVIVLSAANLTPQIMLAGAPGRPGALSVVAWGPDGATLYGAGTYGDATGHKMIRKWPLANPAGANDIPAGDDTITGLGTFGDGKLAFASAAPAWGVLGPTDQTIFRHDRLQADFRDGARGFAVSHDGSVVSFGFRQGALDTARFDVLNGTMELNPAPRPDLILPVPENGRSALTDWRNGDKPKLNGRPLALDANEIARSGAMVADATVMGTDFFLRAYRGGQQAWRTEVPAPAWTVNISGDGRLAVAGLGDGTIRWYRMSDGVEILSLFAEPDGTHWVLWTPEGFFDHGQGGENIIGYQLNKVVQGRPTGSAFVRVEQLYALFFRRDLVVKKFLGNAEDEIKQQLARVGEVHTVLGKGLPPEIKLTEYCVIDNGQQQCQPVAAENQLRGVRGKIQPVPVKSQEVVLHFEVQDQGGGVGPIIVRRQGATVAATGKTRSVNGNLHNEERTLQLQPGLNLVSISSFNTAKEIETDPKDRPGLALRFEVPVVIKPVLRLIAIGIDKFTSKDIPPLANAAADAKGIADTMRADAKKDIFTEVDAVVLTDKDATLAAIDKAFDDMAARAKPDDISFVFLAGHGIDLDGKYYYLPTDLSGLKPEDIKKSALTGDDLAAHLGKFPTSHAVVVLDTCYSGAFAVNDSILRDSRDQTMGKQISHATGRFILASSSSQQEALDGVNGHGVFTEVMLKGLDGDADKTGVGNKDGKISIFELGEYTKTQVPTVAAKVGHGHDQKPRWFFNGDDMFDLRDATN
jgi:WD40 repeat protein